MPEALTPEQLRQRVSALAVLGADVAGLEARLAQAASAREGGDLIRARDLLSEVSAAVGRAAAGASLAVAEEGEVAPGGSAEVAEVARREVEAALTRMQGAWRDDLLNRTISEVSARTARGLADLVRSGAFLEKIGPALQARAEDVARRAVNELAAELRRGIQEELAAARASAPASAGAEAGPGGAPADSQAVVDAVLQKLHDAGILDRKPAVLPGDWTPAKLFESPEFKELLEDRLYHIVNYVKNELLPQALKGSKGGTVARPKA
ncbi:MAG: hypothetical protein L0216_21630 [Planctomycetales bacterium]|nr:hypothetical protein [Planctomycetales bacterium]